MPIPASYVGYGPGDFEPADTTNPTGPTDHFVSLSSPLPSFVWLRHHDGRVEALDHEQARSHVGGTVYAPWTWIGMLCHRQVIEVPAGLLAAERRQVAGVEFSTPVQVAVAA